MSNKLTPYQKFLFRLHGQLTCQGFNHGKEESANRLRKAVRAELRKEGIDVWSRPSPEGKFTKL